MKYLPLAMALTIGLPYALGTLFLASLYQAISKYVIEVTYHRVGGALWFVQVWIFEYFLKLSGVDSFPSISFGLSVAQSIRTISTNFLSSFFLSLANHFLPQLYLEPDTIF